MPTSEVSDVLDLVSQVHQVPVQDIKGDIHPGVPNMAVVVYSDPAHIHGDLIALVRPRAEGLLSAGHGVVKHQLGGGGGRGGHDGG